MRVSFSQRSASILHFRFFSICELGLLACWFFVLFSRLASCPGGQLVWFASWPLGRLAGLPVAWLLGWPGWLISRIFGLVVCPGDRLARWLVVRFRQGRGGEIANWKGV